MKSFEIQNGVARKKTPIWVTIAVFAMQHRVAILFSFLLASAVFLNSMNQGATDGYAENSAKVKSFSLNEDDVKFDVSEMYSEANFNDAASVSSSFYGNDYDDDIFVEDIDNMSEEELLTYRTTSIEARLGGAVSRLDLLRDKSTPYGKAFDFIVKLDKRQLEPTDDLLIQRYVLALIYYSNNGENWSYGNLHFLTEVHECHWKKKAKTTLVGVIDCDSGLRVTKLELSGQNLNGPIPTEIGLLDRLTSLDLGNNMITGTLPSQLGQLVKLKYLSLVSNICSGAIPTELGQLDKAEEILLHFNELTGSVPESMCDLKNDKVLYNLWTDCAASTPPLYCKCCTMCCNGFEACGSP